MYVITLYTGNYTLCFATLTGLFRKPLKGIKTSHIHTQGKCMHMWNVYYGYV